MAKVERGQFLRDWASECREVKLSKSEVGSSEWAEPRLLTLQRAAFGLFGVFALAVLRDAGIPVTRIQVAAQFTEADRSLAALAATSSQGRN